MPRDFLDDDNPPEWAIRMYQEGMRQLKEDKKTMTKAQLKEKGLSMLRQVAEDLKKIPEK